MTSRLDWRILEALDDRVWRANFYAKLAGWPRADWCWEWQGARDERGFGRVRLPVEAGGQTVHPHRVCWLAKYDQVYPGLVLQKKPAKVCVGRHCANDACWFEGPAGRLSWWVRKGLASPAEVTPWNGFVKHTGRTS